VPLGDPREASIRAAINFLSGTACTARIADASAGAAAMRRSAPIMTEPAMLTPDRPSAAQRELPGLF
jgi:carboxyl-terminal processing protease